MAASIRILARGQDGRIQTLSYCNIGHVKTSTREAKAGQNVNERFHRRFETITEASTRERLLNALDSLYNPYYGYFTKQAIIFSPGKPFEFNKMRNEPDFFRQLGERYTSFEDELDGKELDETRQLWHTPTELFRPYYGEAIARYLVANYKLSLYPYHDLLIYEMGAGNGTLMLNILDYIRDTDPKVYARTKFKVIEVSDTLAQLQTKQLTRSIHADGHAGKVEIINQSIFDWTSYVASPCFFLALEVFDNFAHDALRFDRATEEPLQGSVLIDAHGDFYEFYTRGLDPAAARLLRVRRAACRKYCEGDLAGSRLVRQVTAALPLAGNLTPPEWIPTRLMQFFDVLDDFFPAHRLVTSDFRVLPDTVKGVNAPVVQTRYKRRTVPVSTPLVSFFHHGFLFSAFVYVKSTVLTRVCLGSARLL